MKTFILATLLFCTLSCSARDGLKQKIQELIQNRELKLGFALYDFNTGEMVEINSNDRFPMQSVYKFPIAVAMLHRISKGEFSLSDSIAIQKEELYLDLWSPLSERYPNGVILPLYELTIYMVAHSDNCATDIILRMMGGADKVQTIIDSLGIRDIQIRNSEREMQSSWEIQFDNWTTPFAMVELLKQFNNKELLSENENDFLWQVMVNTSTGSVKRFIPETVVVAHKTGYSGQNLDGVIAAQNDVGVIELEDGRRVAFAVFISDSKEGVDAGYDIIAQIGKTILTHYAPQ